MNDFDYDVMQKKRIAAGAKHRKCGSKTHYVSLPSDNLTAKELRAMNGEVTTWKMDEPKTWAEYKEMPKDIQREYLKGLKEKYKVGAPRISAMLGCPENFISSELRKYGLNYNIPDSRAKYIAKQWGDFLERGGTEPRSQGEVNQPERTEKPVLPDAKPNLELISGSITLLGTVEQICYYLTECFVFAEKQKFKATICWECEK